MYLSKLTYRDADWEIGPIHFSQQNLIVGPNASGKSTLLRYIRDFVRIVLGHSKVDAVPDCRYELEFSNDIGIVTYLLHIQGGKIVKELLETSGTVRLSRDERESRVGDETVNVPDTTLVLNARRDIVKYPDIEMVLTWVEKMSSFIFSNILSSNNSVSPFTTSQLDICLMWEKLKDVQKDAVKDWMRELHYSIRAIDIATNKLGEKSLFVIEDNVESPVIMGSMSNGMFRVLYLLVYLHYIASYSSGVVLIDDIGEGLDYFRSSLLGKKIFAFAQEHGVQMIVTSNDSFLVDTVDLSAWILLKRAGRVVTAISAKTNPEDFNRFRKLGLSNFDLMKTDFLVRYFD